MEDIKIIIANNLMNLRKANKLTQLELAEKLNYSDKAISKWERGESLPDIILLKQLADMYGVSIDYLMQEHIAEEVRKNKRKEKVNNELIITLLSCLVVWICATVLYVNFLIVFDHNFWTIWLWAIPITCIVLIVFSSIWGHRKHILISTTCLVWSFLVSLHLQFLTYNLWSIYLIGIPIQLAIILWAGLKKKRK